MTGTVLAATGEPLRDGSITMETYRFTAPEEERCPRP